MYPVIDPNAQLSPVRNSRLKLAAGKLFWREIGAGQPVLFLHDAWSDGTDWEFLLPHLPSGYQVFSPDLLGFGDSDRPRPPHSIAAMVDSLVEWMAALQMPPAIVVGQGLGGWLAATLAARHPDCVRGLVLITPEGIIEPRLFRRWRGDRGLLGFSLNILTRLPGVKVLARLLGQAQRWQRLEHRQQQRRRSAVACQLLFRRRRTELAAEDARALLPHITQPTLLVYGRQDAEPLIDLTQTYAQTMPSAEVKVVSTVSQSRQLADQSTLAELALWDWIQAR